MARFTKFNIEIRSYKNSILHGKCRHINSLCLCTSCNSTRDAQKELIVEMDEDRQEVYENRERREVIYQAQEGELINYLDQSSSRRVVQTMLTWENVK